MQYVIALTLCLTSQAFAVPCLDAGVIEMAAAVKGTGSWQAVVDAHRAALGAGCDDPLIALNLARAQQEIATASPEPGPSCAAVDAYRVVLDRGEPSEVIATARARSDELTALCAARRARTAALEDDRLDACEAVSHYDALGERQPSLTLRVGLEAEANPLRLLCARRLYTEARALDAHSDRASACAAYQRYRVYHRMSTTREADAAARQAAARDRCGRLPPTPRWFAGLRAVGGLGWHLGETPPGQDVGPAWRVGGDAIVERRDRLTLQAVLGYRHGTAHVEDTPIDRAAEWRWHAITVGVGARMGLIAGLDLAAGVGAEVLLAADATSDGMRYAIDGLSEPVTFNGELGAGWTFDPLRVELLVAVDLGPRAALGPGGRLAHGMLALTYLFALSD